MSEREFSQGDPVFVASLRREGTVLEQVRGDRYRVAIGSMVTTCAASDLEPRHGGKGKKKPAKVARATSHLDIPKASPPATSLDLHGMTAAQALREVEAYVDRAILSGTATIRIIHGLGTGKLQKVVHDYLGSLRVVKGFKINQWNPGETEVYF